MEEIKEVIKHIDLPGKQGRLYLKQRGLLKFKKHVLFFHDLGEYHARYSHFSDFLIGNKVGCSFIDMRGHGLSSGTRGHIGSLKELMSDFHVFWNQYKKEYADKDVIVIGHGVGALISMLFLLNNLEIKGCVMVNPTIKYKKSNNLNVDEYVGLKSLFDKIKVRINLSSNDLLEQAGELDQNRHDPLINKKVTFSMYKTLLELFKQAKYSSYFINRPLLYLIGQEDGVVDLETSELFASSIDQGVIELKKYPRLGHELFNELERDKAFKDIYNWIEINFINEMNELENL